MSRLDVELCLGFCSLSDDAAGALIECLLHSDRGPVELINCEIDIQILARALTGDSRVTRLEPAYLGTNAAELAVFFTALANNRGLVDLNLEHCSISNDNWNVLCESLQAQPTLTSINLRGTRPTISRTGPAGGRIRFSDEQNVHRTRAMAEMVQRNTTLHTIELSADERDEQIYAETIQPYLETNRYRPRVDAITKADISLRRPLLGLALQTESVRNKSNLLWMFPSGNSDGVLQSNTDGEQVVDVAASAPVGVAASVPAEVVADVPVEEATTRKRKAGA
jgi:hypothetical protein